MIRPGKMLKFTLKHIFKKPATTKYPYPRSGMPKGFRGRLKFRPELCIGCKLCMKDCPSGAITIKKVGEKQFEAEIDLGRCIYCAQCVDSCVKKALGYTDQFELAQLDREKLKVVYGTEPKEGTKK
ncbi:MAG: 4Fe-4S binding protein [Candidatus Omnitrophica bacterium]|nr:4Fe-4S binding protein [Candidatus Omnitrophota bacterium]